MRLNIQLVSNTCKMLVKIITERSMTNWPSNRAKQLKFLPFHLIVLVISVPAASHCHVWVVIAHMRGNYWCVQMHLFSIFLAPLPILSGLMDFAGLISCKWRWLWWTGHASDGTVTHYSTKFLTPLPPLSGPSTPKVRVCATLSAFSCCPGLSTLQTQKAANLHFLGGWVWGLGSKYSLSNGWCQWYQEKTNTMKP